ncbi:uncharacterized protein LOC115620312 [Scaptodrosophila lebanonensis]|uniref:Uncharacterized protein LOC115620312 n=1 Tax=Drosophila lebanonensis TaxID=7225 RepID=A0A6J2T2B2_DROLE|nr:uncharacterized protein LOC115620312 [Scaptodrosophila lebanonensis]
MCICLLPLLGWACATNLAYLPRQSSRSLQHAYHYEAPSSSSYSSLSAETNPSTMAALRRIILGHLQRFQQADSLHEANIAQFSRRALTRQAKPDTHLAKRLNQMAAVLPYAASASHEKYALPPNTPTPKNYAQNFLPDGEDVVPGSSYIPLRLLLIR